MAPTINRVASSAYTLQWQKGLGVPPSSWAEVLTSPRPRVGWYAALGEESEETVRDKGNRTL